MTWNLTHLCAYVVTLFISLACAFCFIRAMDQTAQNNLVAEHYRCMKSRTPHCLHTEVEYEKELLTINNQ